MKLRILWTQATERGVMSPCEGCGFSHELMSSKLRQGGLYQSYKTIVLPLIGIDDDSAYSDTSFLERTNARMARICCLLLAEKNLPPSAQERPPAMFRQAAAHF